MPLFDPLFWQSLVKALGCRDENYREHFVKWIDFQADDVAIESWLYLTNSWMYWRHRFIDHPADGKTVEEFFRKLN